MAATRTQIYLTHEQRDLLDRIAERDGATLAAVIRDAVDQYLDRSAADPDVALESSFGVAPDFDVPSRDEWSRRIG